MRTSSTRTRITVASISLFAALSVWAGGSGWLSVPAQAGAEAKVTVNSAGNTDDGDCEGPPNDNVLGGDCTVYEAINAANNGVADVINFHPAVFPVGNPRTITVDSADMAAPDGIENSLECLPSIQRDGITIDASGSGVIIDGDDDDDPSAEIGGTPEECPAVFYVQVTANGFDFTVIGGGNLTIKQFDADGIQIDGSSNGCTGCSVGTIDISGVIIEQVGNDNQDTNLETECFAGPPPTTPSGKIVCYPDIDASDNTDGGGGDGIAIENVGGANAIHINDNIIDTEYADFSDGGSAIEIEIDHRGVGDGIFDTDMLIDISGNRLNAEAEAVLMEVFGDLGDYFTGDTNSVLMQVNENGKLASDNKMAVSIEWEGCIFKSPLTIEVDGNQNITADTQANDAVNVDVGASYANGNCSGVQERALGQAAGPVGTPFGSEFAQLTISVSDNGSIGAPSGEDGVDIDVDICCGSTDGHAKHVSTIHVDRNEDIRGDQRGVVVTPNICCFDGNSSIITISENGELTGGAGGGADVFNNVGSPIAVDVLTSNGDADDNAGIIEVSGNGRITGGQENGVSLENRVGSFSNDDGSGDENLASIELSDNERILGDSAGVHMQNYAGSNSGEADGNGAEIQIANNGRLEGRREGLEIQNYAGSLSFLFGGPDEGDDNVTDLLIQGNDDISGLSAAAIFSEVFAGGFTKGSTRNVNNVTITENALVEGLGSDGIFIGADVCCSTQKQGNENVLEVSSNEKIIGHVEDGLDIEVCCTASINRTLVDGNGRIVGGEDDGIEYAANTGDDFPGGGQNIGLSHDLKQDGFINTVNELIITNNLLEDSENNGIYVCCGAFESAENDVKSLIRDNEIRKNVDHGIEINTSFGLNIEHNLIYLNGDEADTDAGIIIHNEASLGFGDDGEEALTPNVWFEVPANSNRISDNSIFDNKGLGIDLAADPNLDGLDDENHGVGCQAKAEPVNPNDCLDYPVFKTQSGDKLLGTACSLCTVEIFMADADPADQGVTKLGVNRQHGEGIGSDKVEGHYYLATGQADADGNWSIVLPCGQGAMDLTATATDKIKNTSEFAANISTLGTSACGTATFTATNTPVPTTPAPTATNTPPVTPPTATNTSIPPTATPTTGPAKACGDVNDNGSVDAVDAQLILQYKAGLIPTLPNLPSADVNDSGEVTSVDAALVLQVEAGLIPLGTLHCG